MNDLVPIKVIIENGKTFKYPDFNQLQCVKNWMKSNEGDWSNYISIVGNGWQYDNVGTFGEDDGETPEGKWCGLLLMPREFVEQALVAFPDNIFILNETECQEFYDNRHAKDFPDEEIDKTILEGIKLKKDLGLVLTSEQEKALDPTDDTIGIRKNKNKKWVDYKVTKSINVIDITK